LSVTFPIYAISVNFVSREKWESKKERAKKPEAVRDRIDELTLQMATPGLAKTAMKEFKIEKKKVKKILKETSLRSHYLSLWGGCGNSVHSAC
jgi:hypothetical protein